MPIRSLFSIITLLAVLAFAGGVQAMTKAGRYTTVGRITCGEYIEAYSKVTLTGDSTYESTSYMAINVFGFLGGFLTAYNMYIPNGKKHVLASMAINDARRWLASWCRDNPAKAMHHGLEVLINKLKKK